MIITGSMSQSLGISLAEVTGRELASVSFERFPDGEQKATIGSVEEDVVIVASTLSDASHVELLQLQDAAREAGAETITTVIPYLGYARQDHAFDEGDPVSARAMARAISTGTDRVLTVTPHEQAVCDFFDVPAEVVDGCSRLAEPLSDLNDPLFLAPDEGAEDLARTVRDAYGIGDTDHFEKTRHSSTDVDIEPRDASVRGRDVVLVDDIIATGSTMSESVGILDRGGAEDVIVACIHPLLAGNARLKLARAGVERIYGTDTIERPVSAVSVAPSIANHL
jgi:ribose-phosphate pyrophosphokinase